MAQWKQFSPCHESKQCCGLCKVAKISAGCICQTAACWPKTVCGQDRVHYKSAPQSLNISTWKQQMCNKSMWHRLTIQLTPFSFIKRDAITQKSDEAQLLPPDPCWPKKKLLSKLWLGDVLPFSDVQTFSSPLRSPGKRVKTGQHGYTPALFDSLVCDLSIKNTSDTQQQLNPTAPLSQRRPTNHSSENIQEQN